jgi:hypothetical protein
MHKLILFEFKKLYQSQIDGDVNGLLSVKLKESLMGYTKDFLSIKFLNYDREKILELSNKIFPNFKDRKNHLQYCIDHFYEMIVIELGKLDVADTPGDRLMAIDGVLGTFHHLGKSLDIMLKSIQDADLEKMRKEIDDIYYIAEFLKNWNPRLK